MTHTHQPSLLALFAHPDDEAFSSGGTLAHYARLGVQVHLICTTRGEVGKITDPELGEVLDVGAFREQELRRACEALGIEAPTFLNYHDSGRLERLKKDDPLASINADPLEMRGEQIKQRDPREFNVGHADVRTLEVLVICDDQYPGRAVQCRLQVLVAQHANRVACCGVGRFA